MKKENVERLPGNAAEILRLDRQICFPLYAASNLLTKLYRPVLAELGLTYPQYLVMLVLWEQSPQSVGSLGESLHLDGGTLTPLLKRMESAQLINRQRDAEDERRVVINLTPKGKLLQREAVRVPLTLGQQLRIDEEEIENLREAVKNLVQLMSAR